MQLKSMVFLQKVRCHLTNPLWTLVCLTGVGLFAGCGSDTDSGETTPMYSIGGTVQGLGGIVPLKLSLNGQETLAMTTDGSFSFPTKVESGTTYTVSMDETPPALRCEILQETGVVGQKNVENISIGCTCKIPGVCVTIALDSPIRAFTYHIQLIEEGKVVPVASWTRAFPDGATQVVETIEPLDGTFHLVSWIDVAEAQTGEDAGPRPGDRFGCVGCTGPGLDHTKTVNLRSDYIGAFDMKTYEFEGGKSAWIN